MPRLLPERIRLLLRSFIHNGLSNRPGCVRGFTTASLHRYFSLPSNLLNLGKSKLSNCRTDCASDGCLRCAIASLQM